MSIRNQALEYHSSGRKGKIEVVPTKPCTTQRDLSLAYTPGVAQPCLEIEGNPDLAYEYTAKGNLVAVISNGTAVLGLGNIGPLAGKPVMEGKGVLFKRFADVDVFDIEIKADTVDEMVKIISALEPTFGGINLEDIKAPECFEVERQLSEKMNIPIFHDDQHGTAIISAAAFLNALELTGRDIKNTRVVFSGAGAAAIATARLYHSLGLPKQNVLLVDTKGVVYRGRTDGMNPYKEEFAADTSKRTLAEAMEGADAFIGVSVKDLVTQDMVRAMAKTPIVFAMANPDPEITYESATAARSDVIMATGRSDYPNQVNNVLGFPFIFRGALDVRAKAINVEMKLAAVRALAELAKEDVPDSVLAAYNVKRLSFGKEYLIPKPFDPRVLTWVAPAVAQAATETGVARLPLTDVDAYREQLAQRVDRSRVILRPIFKKAKSELRKIVFPEGDHPSILRAAAALVEDKFCRPVLLGPEKLIEAGLERYEVDPAQVDIINPVVSEAHNAYTKELWELRQRRGMTEVEASRWVRRRLVYGALMVRTGDAHGMVAGVTRNYPEVIETAIDLVGIREPHTLTAGVYMMVHKGQSMLFSDALVNMDPTPEQLAEITEITVSVAPMLGIDPPRVAMLSFSNFGSVNNAMSQKMQRAVELVRARCPSLIVDGELQPDVALTAETLHEYFPFSRLKEPANVLIFPSLSAANIAYKLVHKLGAADSIGPILVGLNRPVNWIPRIASPEEIVKTTAITVNQSHEAEQFHRRRKAV
ncbi:MAG: NADP-dependent malic enzyme [Deltaproteobacteria bacterium]|nr:NADP-dependent malic enzyme [Deltaproteobacteria bacterium]